MFHDAALVKEVDQFLKDYPCAAAVETGTNEGHGAMALAERFKEVVTIEANPKFYDNSILNMMKAGWTRTITGRGCEMTKIMNHRGEIQTIRPVLGDSGFVLWQNIPAAKPVLFYLDAHWESHCPILDELAAIALTGHTDARIIIHDFPAPCSSFTWQANGRNFNLDYVRNHLLRVNSKMKWWTNRETDCNRGALFAVAHD
jgi:hypothetical protein